MDAHHVWTPSISLDAPHMFEYHAICLGDVWMSPVYTQHIESMLCHTKGVSICPIHLDASICVDAPCMFGCPHMFGWPPVCLNAPICVDTPCMFACPHVWTPTICLDATICLNTTNIFGCPAVCLDAPCMLGWPISVALLAMLFSLLQCLDAPCMY